MKIALANAGKRYRTEWIFQNLDLQLESGGRYAILGPNGSGKSTLMKVLSGHLSLSKGQIQFFENDLRIEPDALYRRVSYAAPYIELIEEFTLEETLRFHAKLKPFRPEFTPSAVYDLLQLPRSAQKTLRFFSSGMKQRVKLALALCSDTPLVLLDEPATNLDLQGIDWYKNMIRDLASDRLVVIASNDPHDAEFCPEHIHITEFKKKKAQA